MAQTPTPANEATAAWMQLVADAEAFLTGTPTPPPAGAVTPIIITPTEVPENIMTAAANALAATAEIAANGTPTAWAYNVIVATVTPPRFVIVNTPRPANAATAAYIAAYATAVTQLTGTFTPFPYNAVTATPSRGPGTPAPAPKAAAKATATPAPKAAATPTASLISCPDPRVQINAPAPGQEVGREIELNGRAVHEAMAGYVVAFAPGSMPAEGYTEVFRGQGPVDGGVLGVFQLTELPDGTYTIGLRVLTSTGDPPPPCLVVIRVRNQ